MTNDLLSDEHIKKANFSDALSERYLAYALSTITARSLPDVRDGLKPVHRRLLFAMRQLKLDPDQGFKKSARVVGDVMGKFHPHGDAAIYDAMNATLAALHSVDPANIGLNDYGKPGNYFERQVSRWGQQYKAAENPHRPYR